MAIITRKQGKIALMLSGVIVITCDSIDEAREWMEVLGLTYSIQYV